MQHVNGITEGHAELEGYSFPLCKKIVESLAKSNMKFQIHTLHVLGHNTRRDSEGNSYPIFSGLLVSSILDFSLVYSADYHRTREGKLSGKITNGAKWEKTVIIRLLGRGVHHFRKKIAFIIQS